MSSALAQTMLVLTTTGCSSCCLAGARLKVMRCVQLKAPEDKRALLDFSLGVGVDLDRQVRRYRQHIICASWPHAMCPEQKACHVQQQGRCTGCSCNFSTCLHHLMHWLWVVGIPEDSSALILCNCCHDILSSARLQPGGATVAVSAAWPGAPRCVSVENCRPAEHQAAAPATAEGWWQLAPAWQEWTGCEAQV